MIPTPLASAFSPELRDKAETAVPDGIVVMAATCLRMFAEFEAQAKALEEAREDIIALKAGGAEDFNAIMADDLARFQKNTDAGREWLRRAWYELNAIKASRGAPEGVSHEWWAELTDALGAMLGNDTVPWMTAAAKVLVAPYETRAHAAEQSASALAARCERLRVAVTAQQSALGRLRADAVGILHSRTVRNFDETLAEADCADGIARAALAEDAS